MHLCPHGIFSVLLGLRVPGEISVLFEVKVVVEERRTKKAAAATPTPSASAVAIITDISLF